VSLDGNVPRTTDFWACWSRLISIFRVSSVEVPGYLDFSGPACKAVVRQHQNWTDLNKHRAVDVRCQSICTTYTHTGVIQTGYIITPVAPTGTTGLLSSG